jgi:hypothetical protein
MIGITHGVRRPCTTPIVLVGFADFLAAHEFVDPFFKVFLHGHQDRPTRAQPLVLSFHGFSQKGQELVE